MSYPAQAEGVGKYVYFSLSTQKKSNIIINKKSSLKSGKVLRNMTGKENLSFLRMFYLFIFYRILNNFLTLDFLLFSSK